MSALGAPDGNGPGGIYWTRRTSFASGYGHQLHVWNLRKRRHQQAMT